MQKIVPGAQMYVLAAHGEKWEHWQFALCLAAQEVVEGMKLRPKGLFHKVEIQMCLVALMVDL